MRRPRFERSSSITVFSVFFQMVGKEPFFSLLTAPSTWTDRSNESGVKWSEQTAKRPSGLKCARCVPTKAFHFARRVLSIGDLWTEIPAVISENYCILAQHNVVKARLYKKHAKESWGTILSNFIPSFLQNQNNNSLSRHTNSLLAHNHNALRFWGVTSRRNVWYHDKN